MSDYLLSLETRDDLTALVLVQTDAKKILLLVSRILMKDDATYNFQSRAKTLMKHWSNITLSTAKDTPEEMLADRPIAPSKKDLPDDKPVGWKLDLGEARTAEAQRQLELSNLEKIRCIKYWSTVKPPRVMGWIPVDGEAWKKVPRADLENGDLFFTPYFKPIWESYSMARMDVSFWTDPDATDEEEVEYREARTKRSEMTTLSLKMRRVRKEYAELLGFKGVR